jgi:hypothetical protein
MNKQQPVRNSTRRRAPSTSSRTLEVEVRPFDSWPKLRDELDRLSDAKKWVFRGQEKAKWGLTHTLYRQLQNRGVKRRDWRKQEKRIIRMFSRKAHLFLPALPRNFLEWIALMQHHGAPTRLLDFTWSPYVAAFFALDNATEDEDAAIWAVNEHVLNADRDPALSTSSKILPPPSPPWDQDPGLRHCLRSGKRTACIMSPFVMNQRLIAQSGTFLVPTVLDAPLDELLLERHQAKRAVLKLCIRTSKVRRAAIWDLYQMNISQATLFPGLDGLARSMAQELEVNWK